MPYGEVSCASDDVRVRVVFVAMLICIKGEDRREILGACVVPGGAEPLTSEGDPAVETWVGFF